MTLTAVLAGLSLGHVPSSRRLSDHVLFIGCTESPRHHRATGQNHIKVRSIGASMWDYEFKEALSIDQAALDETTSTFTSSRDLQLTYQDQESS
jgi:hypothetical protein